MYIFKSLLATSAALVTLGLAGKDTDFLNRIDSINAAIEAGRRGGVAGSYAEVARRSEIFKPHTYLNERSKRFAVNGTSIPEVHFDVGESYAGLLPISSKSNETRKLYFWFFPSENSKAGDEITIWLNGGPGCSSLKGLMTENGPFLWEPGTFAPVKNPYSWHKTTNMVWIEQPVGTGFSQGEPDARNEEDVAEQFKGFWKNFVDTFRLYERNVYITGESYAGMFVPYISHGFLKENNTKYFNIKGLAINNPLIGDFGLQSGPMAFPFVEYWSNILGFNDELLAKYRNAYRDTGFEAYVNKYFTFPPPAQPWAVLPNSSNQLLDIEIYSDLSAANPCFNMYHINKNCPFPHSQFGGVNTGDYNPQGSKIYFQRQDVQKAINAPLGTKWKACGVKNVFPNGDASLGPAIDGTLTTLIDKLRNVIIGSGALDFINPTNGTLFALQNTTWGGLQGFQKFPTTEFFVPNHTEPEPGRQGSYGNIGVWRQERGLTFYDIKLAGHRLPQNSASGGLRVIQRLVGRIKDFSSHDPLF